MPKIQQNTKSEAQVLPIDLPHKKALIPSHLGKNGTHSVSILKPSKPQTASGLQAELITKNETITSLKRLEGKKGGNATKQPISHQWLFEYITQLEQEGLTRNQIKTRIRNEFPDDYKAAMKKWKKHKDNAKARGVYVGDCYCDFVAFLKRMGFIPYPSYSIHRINNNRGYTLDNIVWASPETQNHCRGNAEHIYKYAEIKGVNRSTAYRHFNKDPDKFYGLITANDKQFDPSKERLLTFATESFNFWWVEVQSQYPEDVIHIPNRTSKDITQWERLIKQHTPEQLIRVLPAIIENWGTIAVRLKRKYNKVVGDIPTFSDFYRYSTEIVNIWLALEKSQEQEQQQAKQQVIELEPKRKEREFKREQELKKLEEQREQEQKRLAYIQFYLPEFRGLYICSIFSDNESEKTRVSEELKELLTNTGITENEFLKANRESQYNTPPRVRGNRE